MKLRNLFLYITAFTLSAVNTSCKDDEEKDAPDSRIRRVIISQLGSDVEFIVNDTEGKIFNYDSLAYGTRTDSLYPSIYGYDELTIQYSYDNLHYVYFRNTVPMDLSRPVTLLTTNTEDGSQKEYVFDLRVHKYDVDAFLWTKIGTIAGMEDSVISQKSIMHNDEMWQFYQTNTACKAASSTDGAVWTSHAVTTPESLDLTTLCYLGDSLFVQGQSGAFYSADVNKLQFNKLAAIASGRLLYTLNNQIWVFDAGNIKSYSGNGELKISQALPDKFVVDTVCAFTAPSGATTIGYLYAKKGDLAEVWATDRYGNIECLTNTSAGLLYRDKAITFNYSNTLIILGGISADGTYSTECYSSSNSGMTWTKDEHKDLSNAVGPLANAGIFQTNDKGEFLLVGGQTAAGSSNNVWALRLKQLLLEEEFLNKIK